MNFQPAIKWSGSKRSQCDEIISKFKKYKLENYINDIALCNYFTKNISKIENWFNIISPKNKTLLDLKKELSVLSKKNWESIYGTN